MWREIREMCEVEFVANISKKLGALGDLLPFLQISNFWVLLVVKNMIKVMILKWQKRCWCLHWDQKSAKVNWLKRAQKITVLVGFDVAVLKTDYLGLNSYFEEKKRKKEKRKEKVCTDYTTIHLTHDHKCLKKQGKIIVNTKIGRSCYILLHCQGRLTWSLSWS